MIPWYLVGHRKQQNAHHNNLLILIVEAHRTPLHRTSKKKKWNHRTYLVYISYLTWDTTRLTVEREIRDTTRPRGTTPGAKYSEKRPGLAPRARQKAPIRAIHATFAHSYLPRCTRYQVFNMSAHHGRLPPTSDVLLWSGKRGTG